MSNTDPFVTITCIWKHQSFAAKISSLDEVKFLDPPLVLPFKQCETASWQHLHSFSVSIGSHFPLLHHSSTAWLTLLLLFCSVSFSSSSLRNGSWRESLSGSKWKLSTVAETLSIILKNEIIKVSMFHQHKTIQQNIL